MSNQKTLNNNSSRKLKLIAKNKNEDDEENYHSLIDKYNDDYSLLNDNDECKIESDIRNTQEDLENLKQKLNIRSEESSIKSLNLKKESEQKKKKFDDYLNLNNEIDSNELPKVRLTSTNYYTEENNNYLINLQKQLNEINNELNKIKNEKNFKYYQRLENNFVKNSKELYDLKQNNNLLKFQLQDMTRKYRQTSSSNPPSSANNIKKRIERMRISKKNDLAKLYGVNVSTSTNSRISKVTMNENENHKNNRGGKRKIFKIKSEYELFKKIDDENRGLKRELNNILSSVQERENKIKNKYTNKIDELENKTKKLKDDVKKLQNNLTEAINNIEDLKSENENLLGQKNIILKKENKLIEEKNKMNEDRLYYEDEINKLNDEIEEHKKIISKSVGKIKSLNEQMKQKEDLIRNLNLKKI